MRNFFDLSHEHKMSTDMGYLVPIMTEEVLPGDTFIGSSSVLARVAPLANPVMHNVELRVHHWYVPNRILWNGWEDFITGKDEGAQVPSIELGAEDLDLADHMGIVPKVGLNVNALPFYAYNMIWNEFYRDQDLQNQRAHANGTLAKICWGKDYFSVARPHPQQGQSVDIGFSTGEAPVRGIGVIAGQTAATRSGAAYETDQFQISSSEPSFESTALRVRASSVGASDTTNRPKIYADLTRLDGGIDIDDLRRALAMQRFAEARMRYGHRYADYLRFLGVNPSDGRLDRPEYLGGGSQQINFSEVIAMAQGTDSDVGDLYGHGIAGMRSRRYRKMFEEHGWVLSLLSVRPSSVYMNATPRKFMRSEHMDYWQKELEVLPWQTVYENEIHEDGNKNTVFGYVPRYDEYRHNFSYVSGSFRTLEKDWHMGREFANPPVLNGTFVECNPTDRIYSDRNMPEIICNCFNSLKAMRMVRRSASLQGI